MKRLHEEADFDVEEARAALASAEESLTSAQITLRQAKARRDGLDR
jgi:outer membrane protein TolC